MFFLAHFQSLENVLGLVQNLNQNLVAELAPLGLGDLSGLELAEVDVVLVSHAQRLDEKSRSVNGFFADIFDKIQLDLPLIQIELSCRSLLFELPPFSAIELLAFLLSNLVLSCQEFLLLKVVLR